MKIRKLCGVFALVICLFMAGLPVIGGFSMTGLHAGLVLFTGLGGTWLLVTQ